MANRYEGLTSQSSDSRRLLKPQGQRKFRGERFRVFAGTGRLLSRASQEDDTFQLFFPLNGNPQRVTKSDKQPDDVVRGKSAQVLFDGFTPEKKFLREWRLHRKTCPLVRGLGGPPGPHHSVKLGRSVILRACVRIHPPPNAHAA